MTEGDRTSDLAIDYAPTSPAAQRQRLQRRVITWSAIVVVVVVGMLLIPTAIQQLRVQFAFRECLNFTQPPGTIAFETEPAAVQRLLTGPGHYVSEQDSDRHPSPPVASLNPPPLANLATLRTSGWLGWGLYDHPPVVFLGEMKTDQGRPMLVCVEFNAIISYGDQPSGAQFTCNGAERPWFGPPLFYGRQQQFAPTLHGVNLDRQPTRIEYGRVDPADPSHLMIDYIVGTNRLTLHGHLREHGATRERVLEFDDAHQP